MKAEEIVNENFQGLDDLIEDSDLRQFYRSLIIECMEEYARQLITKEEIVKILDSNINTCVECGGGTQNDAAKAILSKLKGE